MATKKTRAGGTSVDPERSRAMMGNKNANGGFGSAAKAIKAFGPRPSGGFLGMSADRAKFDARVDNYLGHSANKKAGAYKIATKRSIKAGGW
jgi:hypothetical protein